MALKSYRDVLVWHQAMDLVESVYQLTRAYPNDERFGLVSQSRRAAVSIPANMAEGYGRSHRREYRRHLSIARGSLAEFETHLLLGVRLLYVSRDALAEVWKLTQSVGKLLSRLIDSLKEPLSTPLDP
jgi:four helix bundle protein